MQHFNTGPRGLIEAAFAGVRAMNAQAVLDTMADDAVFIDPHYPSPAMTGRVAIADGLRWAFAGMESMDFEVKRYFEAEDGAAAAVEVDTHHVLKLGKRHLDFPQVFVVEVARGLVTRWQAYEPYGPGGVAGAFIGAERVRRRLRRVRGRSQATEAP